MFAFHVVLSRELGTARYGSLYTFVSLATFIAVIGGILTIIAARLVAEYRNEPARLRAVCGSAVKNSAYIGIAACALLAVLAIPISRFLREPDIAVALWLAVFAGGQLALAGLRGVLQGLQEFPRLASTMIVEAFVRTGLAILLAFAGFGIASAIGSYAIGTLVAIAGAVVAVRRTTELRFGATGLAVERVARLSLGTALSTLAIAALGVVDVLLVRHYFSNVTSSIYGAVSLVGKMVYFTVGFLPTIVLPKATAGALTGARPARVLLPAALTVALLSVVSLIVIKLVPGVLVSAMTGSQYGAAVPYVFWYAIAMAFLGASNAFVAFRIGVNDFTFIPWTLLLTTGEAAAIAVLHRTLYEVIIVVIVANAAVLVAVLAGMGKRNRFAGARFETDPMLIAEEIQAR